ncbi:hypothetical protein [Microbacterium lacticum]
MPGPSFQGPMNELLNAAVALLMLVFILYAAVWLLEQIWPWLLGMAAVGGLVWLLIVILRWRRSRW